MIRALAALSACRYTEVVAAGEWSTGYEK